MTRRQNFRGLGPCGCCGPVRAEGGQDQPRDLHRGQNARHDDITPWQVLPVGSQVTIGDKTGVVVSRWYAVVNVRFDDGTIVKFPVTRVPND